ncbi:MAG TPA: hypothetical protein VI485_27770 [Vicinamibacterales bacterium]|nr:hypothetical protein [Vicinamibacterales bacterium]
MKVAVVAIALLLWPPLTGAAGAQCPQTLVESTVVRTRSDFTSISEIDIDVTQAVTPSDPSTNETIPPNLIVLTRHPSNQAARGSDVMATGRAMRGNGYKRITITVSAAMTWTPQKDEELEITVGPLLLECGPAMIVGTANVIDSMAEQKERLKLTQDELAKATAYATPIDQKNFYAMIATAKGDGGDGAGAADILIDQTIFTPGRQVGALFDNAAIKFMTKKSSGANADPRTQLAGLEFTKALLWGSANRARKGEDLEKEERVHLTRGGGWFRGAVIYQLLNVEGDAYDFNAVNFVSDTQFTVPSIAKRLGTAGRGFFNFRVVAGSEIGRSRRKPEPGTADAVTSTAVSDVIFRGKLGGDLTLRWGRADTDPSKFAVELDVGHVTRLLGHAESAVKDIVEDGKTVQERVTIEKGQRHWTQANVRVFLFGTEQARYGVQLTYYNGSLPPLFAQSKAFQFGMVIETSPATTSPGK